MKSYTWFYRNIDFDVRSASGRELKIIYWEATLRNIIFKIILKEYNRPYLTHIIIGLWVISRVLVKIIEELSFKWKFFCRFRCAIRIIVTITPCYKLNSFLRKYLRFFYNKW